MLDFRQQILERAFGPDMDGPGMNGPDMAGPNMQQFKDGMMEPLVPKLMCAISEGTRKCECSNEFRRCRNRFFVFEGNNFVLFFMFYFSFILFY